MILLKRETGGKAQRSRLSQNKLTASTAQALWAACCAKWQTCFFGVGTIGCRQGQNSSAGVITLSTHIMRACLQSWSGGFHCDGQCISDCTRRGSSIAWAKQNLMSYSTCFSRTPLWYLFVAIEKVWAQH